MVLTGGSWCISLRLQFGGRQMAGDEKLPERPRQYPSGFTQLVAPTLDLDLCLSCNAWAQRGVGVSQSRVMQKPVQTMRVRSHKLLKLHRYFSH